MSVKNSQIRYTFIIFRFQFLSKENLKKFNIFFARNYTHIYVHKHTYKTTYKPTYIYTYKPTYIYTYKPTYIYTYKPTYIYTYKKQKDKNLSALNFTDVDAVLYTRQQPHL